MDTSRSIYKVILIALLVSSLSADVLDEDKKQHMIAGMLIYSSCLFVSLITQKNNIEWLNTDTCLIPVIVAGVGKEVYDHQGYGTSDAMDVLATVAVPVGIAYTWKFKGL